MLLLLLLLFQGCGYFLLYGSRLYDGRWYDGLLHDSRLYDVNSTILAISPHPGQRVDSTVGSGRLRIRTMFSSTALRCNTEQAHDAHARRPLTRVHFLTSTTCEPQDCQLACTCNRIRIRSRIRNRIHIRNRSRSLNTLGASRTASGVCMFGGRDTLLLSPAHPATLSYDILYMLYSE